METALALLTAAALGGSMGSPTDASTRCACPEPRRGGCPRGSQAAGTSSGTSPNQTLVPDPLRTGSQAADKRTEQPKQGYGSSPSSLRAQGSRQACKQVGRRTRASSVSRLTCQHPKSSCSRRVPRRAASLRSQRVQLPPSTPTFPERCRGSERQRAGSWHRFATGSTRNAK